MHHAKRDVVSYRVVVDDPPDWAAGADPRLLTGLEAVAASAALARAARRWPWPDWLRPALAASAIAELAMAGLLVAGSRDTPAELALAAAAGAVGGALLALAACPGAVTTGLLALGLLCAVGAGGLGAEGINAPRCAVRIVAVKDGPPDSGSSRRPSCQGHRIRSPPIAGPRD